MLQPPGREPVAVRVEIARTPAEIQRKILQKIREDPGVTQVKIAEQLGVARKVVNYHIKILKDAGLIFMEMHGRESACYLMDKT